MVALTADRNTPRMEGDERQGLLAANQTIWAGAMLMRNNAGYLLEAATATGMAGVGVALERMTSTTVAVTPIRWRAGTFRFANSAAGEAIAAADIGNLCYMVDDQTVARTDGTGTRSAAGFVEGVDAIGVWVRFDEPLTLAMLS